MEYQPMSIYSQEIISLKDAKLQGLKWYFTGKPCPHGHITKHCVSNRSCYLCSKKRAKKHAQNNKEYYALKHKDYRKVSKNRIRIMYRSAQKRAKNNNLPFTITEQDIVIPKRCPIFNEIEFLDDSGNVKNNIFANRNYSPSLDRIDNNLGYVPGNIIVISDRANRLKSNASIDELEKIVKFYKFRNAQHS
jgi:hypothetical protein